MKLSYLIKASAVAITVAAVIAPFSFLKPPKSDVSSTAEPLKQPSQEVVKAVPKKPVVVEKPLHNVALPDFANIRDVKEKKRQFFAFLRPAVEKENASIMIDRQQVETIINKLSLEEPLADMEGVFLSQMAKKYRVSSRFSQLHQAHLLLDKIDIIPVELVLVQAANESAWGTSRFARIGLNFFGIWCYNKGCGMVPSGRNVGAKHEVEAFKSVEDAVHRYTENINRNNAYVMFRTLRAQLRDNDEPLSAEVLATGLLAYSERGIDYVLELSQMIRHNHQYFVQAQAD